MTDHYGVLGVAPGAPPTEIRAAFRRWVRSHRHPDHGGDPAAWQEASEAAATLGDPERRRRYDLEQLVAHLRSDLGLRRCRGQDVREELTVTFLQALRGAELTLRGRKVRVPPGARDGFVTRLVGLGDAGNPPGDLVLVLRVGSHASLRRDPQEAESQGRDLVMDLPVSVYERYRGGPLSVPTPWGPFYMRFDPGDLRDGEEVVLQRYGVRCGCSGQCGCRWGDLRVRVRLQEPPTGDLALLGVLARLQGQLDPRAALAHSMEDSPHGP